MPTLATHVEQLLIAAFETHGFDSRGVRAVPAQRPDLADLQCNAAMPLGGATKRPPREIAEAVAGTLRGDDAFDSVEVAGPGFINLRLSSSLLGEWAERQRNDESAGIVAQPPETVVIDFGGPNVAKPLHVGHLRSLVLGESLRRILIAQGHRVIGDVHLGDWGLQMGMLISELPSIWPELAEDGPWTTSPPFDMAQLQAIYPRVAAACKADDARMAVARAATAKLQAGDAASMRLWETIRRVSLDAQTADFAALGAHFDELNGESLVQPLIPAMIADLKARGIARESEGALVVDVAEEGDDSPVPPLLLEKSDGAALYATTDMATILDRRDRLHPSRIVYVVDQRQALHFRQVFRAAMRAGHAEGIEMVHVGFGTVNGRDGKPYKTRDGGVAQLHELLADAVGRAYARIEESGDTDDIDARSRAIGIAAVKFADLSTYRTSGYVFDPDRMVSFEGRTGPYVQYACVRITSMLERAAAQGLVAGKILVREHAERSLVLLCARFPDAVASTAHRYAPNDLADYAYDLAQAFSRFYAECPVLAADDADVRSSRLALSGLARHVLAKALDLLGIRVPTRM
ncbi:arginine--tRNA ligase [Luteibacter aegosomatis]|uniref:arginine--tRNA ligase n=1 Tax=Luteibacter aegosomatis TaxID=2911537 RepID=UPI001FFB7EC5|nr:arginine--tRNA ligase [Luteibacter aegosomatis]UPG86287.1 arginine--tRNA ligase [Luteibacter aegosomatis]